MSRAILFKTLFLTAISVSFSASFMLSTSYAQQGNAGTGNTALQALKQKTDEQITSISALSEAMGNKIKDAQTQLDLMQACFEQNMFFNANTQTCVSPTASGSGESCPAQNMGWGSGRDPWGRHIVPCNSPVSESGHGKVVQISGGYRGPWNQRRYSGSAMVQCFSGEWLYVSASCADTSPSNDESFNDRSPNEGTDGW